MQKFIDSNDMVTKSRDYYVNKAMKLKALLDSNQEGERESASKLLSDYMQKYDITWSDLDDALERDFIFPCDSEYKKRLLIQVAYMHLGQGHCYRMYSCEDPEDTATECDTIKVKCRPRDFLEIKLDWEFYCDRFYEELEIFYRAFVEKNEIFPPKSLQKDTDDNDNEELSPEDIKKIQNLMYGIDTYTRRLGLVEGDAT